MTKKTSTRKMTGVTLNDVFYPIVKEMAHKAGEDEPFEKDPELYTVGILLEMRETLRRRRSGTVFGVLEFASTKAAEARKLLKRPKPIEK